MAKAKENLTLTLNRVANPFTHTLTFKNVSNYLLFVHPHFSPAMIKGGVSCPLKRFLVIFLQRRLKEVYLPLLMEQGSAGRQEAMKEPPFLKLLRIAQIESRGLKERRLSSFMQNPRLGPGGWFRLAWWAGWRQTIQDIRIIEERFTIKSGL